MRANSRLLLSAIAVPSIRLRPGTQNWATQRADCVFGQGCGCGVVATLGGRIG
jgi:hypothetical protein